MPRVKKYRSLFKSFKSFNPPDLVRGPFKTSEKHRTKRLAKSRLNDDRTRSYPQARMDPRSLRFVAQQNRSSIESSTADEKR